MCYIPSCWCLVCVYTMFMWSLYGFGFKFYNKVSIHQWLIVNKRFDLTYFSRRHYSEGDFQFPYGSNLKYLMSWPGPNSGTHWSNYASLFCQGKCHNSIRHYNNASLEYTHPIAVSQIKKSLRMYGLTFEDGFTCLIADCPFCLQTIKIGSKGKLFINKTTGYFSCQQCRHSGIWTLFEKLMISRKNSDQLTKKEIDVLKKELTEELEAAASWKLLQKTTVALKTVHHDTISDIVSGLKLTITSATVDQFQIRVDEARTTLFFPMQGCEGQIVGYKTLRCDIGEENTYPTVGSSGLIGSKFVKSTKMETAILVPSLLDALSLSGSKISCQVICLPHGLTSLPQQVLPSLERFSKLILWFGNDIGSWDTARNFAKKLNEKRCFFVRPTDNQPSPQTALRSGLDLKAIVLAAQPIWHQAITSFSTLREDVLSELQNNDKVQGVKWKRFPALNRILKGHRRGEFTVLTGPTGSGKTTFMSEYSLDLATQGVNTLWGSFEIRNARLAKTMLQQMAELPLELNMDQFDSFADQFEKLPIYFMTFHGQQLVKVVMEAVEHATYVHDIGHVIIDNVQFMMGVSDESKHMDRFWKQDAIIASFRSFATKMNCHVTLVIHPRKERDAEDLTTNSIFGGAKAAQEADNVLIIQDKRLTSVRGKKYLQIAKNRYSGDLGVMPLDFDKDRLSYGNRKKKLTDNVDES